MTNARLYAVTFVASLAQLSAGMFLGWVSPMLPKLLVDGSSIKITANEASWILSLLKLGMAFGCFLSIFIVDLIGRKISILLAIIPMFSSWLLIVLNLSLTNLYVVRFIGCTGSGIIFTSGTVYATEISPPYIRGALCSCFVLMDYCGNLLGYVVGLFGTMQQYSYVAMSLAVLQFVMFVWLSETPYYLLYLKRLGSAVDSLIFFRSSADLVEEMDSMMRSVERDSQNNGTLPSAFRLISQSGAKSIILIGAGTATTQAFSSSIILIAYAQTIFEKIHDDQLQGTYICIVLATVHLISFAMCISLADRLGRRPPMLLSTIGVTSCSFLLGVYFCMQENAVQATNLQLLPFVAILFYVVGVSLGLTSVPFVPTNEIFPMYAKATCVSFCFCINFTWSFIVLRIWSFAAFEHNMYSDFWFISALNVFSILFLVLYLPETKGRSFLQIRDALVCATKKCFIVS